MKIHKDLKDIKAYKCDDPELTKKVDIFNPEKILVNSARAFDAKMERQNKEPVVTENKGHKKIVTMSKAQALCYETVVNMINRSERKAVSRVVVEAVFREATVQVLVREGIFVETDDFDLELPKPKKEDSYV